jgi:uncharacterized phage protein (TIGR02218 family)
MKTLPLTLTDRVVRPARLLVITRRDGNVMRIAEAQSAITAGGDVYAPLAGCEISAVKHTIGGDVASMEIRGAHNNSGTAAFLTSDIDIGLYDSAEVSLYIVNRANPTTLGLLFTGTIQPVNYDISGSVSFDVRGPSIGANANYIQVFAPMCRTDLFSPLCGVNPDAYELSAVVTAVVNRFNFTVSFSGAAPADNYLNGGTVLTDSGVAFEIANQAGGSLTAYLPYHRVLAAGMSLTLWPGCDKRIATCHAKFNNTLNFQAEPHSIGIYAAIGGGS